MPAKREKLKRIGRYDLDALIGEGGMGNVYRGLDTKTGRPVAVKVVSLPPEADAADKLRLRFMREVRAVSRVGHPNVVQVHDYGFSDEKVPYLVMELLEGTDLGKVLRSSRTPLPIPYVADVMLEVCAAVRACHAASIIHRDLKPGNIFLAKTDAGPGWQVKVLDFGIAKSPFGDNLTNLGQIVGTLQYLSPEQVNGSAGPESDQYSIGVILYACLTKRLPFAGLKDVALLKAIARGEFAPPRSHRADLPAAVERIILRAMSSAPPERFDSVYELGQQLWPYASGLARRSWERFYTTAASALPHMDTTTAVASPAPPSAGHGPAGAAPEGNDGVTTIGNYESTTVVGLDQAALIGTLPTKVPFEDGESASMATVSLRHGEPSLAVASRGKAVRPVLVTALALLVALALGLALR